ncbi:MAG TPA: PadR family transcriptional regulator [Thermoanaerobaculia bacterium]|nr:PadR family transcriptional regulator [Thermoanaerobaculia bacterium]
MSIEFVSVDNISDLDILNHMSSSLPAATFHILLSLAEEERHGYAIIKDIEASTNDELRLSPGTLYRSIQRMLEEGLIVESGRRPARALDDERRRYYRITPSGIAAARAELRRLAEMIRIGRERGLKPEMP